VTGQGVGIRASGPALPTSSTSAPSGYGAVVRGLALCPEDGNQAREVLSRRDGGRTDEVARRAKNLTWGADFVVQLKSVHRSIPTMRIRKPPRAALPRQASSDGGPRISFHLSRKDGRQRLHSLSSLATTLNLHTWKSERSVFRNESLGQHWTSSGEHFIAGTVQEVAGSRFRI
jgi:hypothetical protein